MKGKQPSRVQLAEHMDELVDALVEIRDGTPTTAWEKAYIAVQAHTKWMKREFRA